MRWRFSSAQPGMGRKGATPFTPGSRSPRFENDRPRYPCGPWPAMQPVRRHCGKGVPVSESRPKGLLWPVTFFLLLLGLLVSQALAQAPSSSGDTERRVELLDRGSLAAAVPARGPSPMMTTLAVGSATPGLTMVSVVGNATMLAAPAFYGNFFAAPADIPMAWFPFDVTGVFAWHSFAPSPPGILFSAPAWLQALLRAACGMRLARRWCPSLRS